MHILNHRNQFGAVQDIMGPIMTVQIETARNSSIYKHISNKMC